MGYVRNELFSSMMASMKKGEAGAFTETIALVNGNADEFAFTNHPTLPKYCMGIREEAKRLGYAINEFWLRDKRLTAESFVKVLRSRGIRGGIILGHSSGNAFPESFAPVWREFYFVSAGIKTCNPSLEMVSADHYAIAYRAAMKAVELGFKRPALVIEEHIDELVEGRFVGGFLRAQLKLSEANRIRPFLEADTSDGYEKKLSAWLDSNRPDVVLYLLDSTREIISALPRRGRKIPLIQLERRGFVHDWTGMEQNNDTVGKVAVRRLADMLSRTSARVGENADMVILVPPTWLESQSADEKKV